MSRDPLQTVLRLRKTAVDTARADLVAHEAQMQAALAAVRRAEAAIAEEMAVASRLDADDGAVEAFARWLPRGRAATDEARARAGRADEACSLARARLTVARSAHEAVESLIQRRDAAAQGETDRRDQLALDELARGSRFGADL